MNAAMWRERIKTAGFEKEIAALYGDKACENAARYGKLIDLYEETFGLCSGTYGDRGQPYRS